MWYNLLSSVADSVSGSASDAGDVSPWPTYIMFGIIVAVMIVFMVYNRRTQQKRQQEQMDTLNAIQPGCKVKTIGGICGVVVEVCPEDNTFVLETGTEASGKSYIKFDKQAVYQTDATAKKEESDPVAETPAEEPFVEETVEVTTEEVVEATEEVVEATEEKTEE